MKLSVVIPCRNAARTIEETLAALTEQTWPDDWEVIVADNGSTDNLVEVMTKYQQRIPMLRLVDASARRGPSYARNKGVQMAAGEGILFCDADDVPGHGWAMAMAKGLKAHDFVAARLDFEKLNAPSLRAARDSTQVGSLQRFRFLPFMHAGSGTLGITRTLHNAVGGFDESIPVCEDIDYCMRVQQQGVKLELIEDAIIHCRLRDSAVGVFTQALRYAKYEVCLYKRYGGGSFCEWWRWRQYAQSWKGVLMRMPELVKTDQGKTMLSWHLGRQIGLLAGSLRFGASPVVG